MCAGVGRGSTSERKVLRGYWNPRNMYTKDADFHVMVSSLWSCPLVFGGRV